jgi:hypothetical protein
MWQAKYEKAFPGLAKESVWAAWSDVAGWPRWDVELESTKIDGPFQAGTKFVLRPKGGPNVAIELISVEPLAAFTDVSRFPLARMYDVHEMRETPEGLKITSIIRVEGPLAWVWRKIVAEGVAAGVPAQLDALDLYARGT